MSEFGNKFRQAREKKNLSRDDVSNVTKIGARMLQAIEEEHFDQLPGGVFNKGFIRAYAKHLGLDAEEAVTDYLACLREAQIGAQDVWETSRPDPARAAAPDGLHAPEPRKPAVKAPSSVQVEELPGLQLPRVEDARPPRGNFRSNPESAIPWTIIAAGSLVIVLAVFLLWMRHSHSTHAARHSSAPVSAPSNTPAPSAAIPAGVKTNSSPAPSQSAQPTPAPPAAKPLPRPTQTAAPASAPSSSQTPAATKEASDVTIRSAPASIPKAAEKPSLTLVIRASETSWISVQSDGQLVSQETLIAPAATSFHATRELVVRVGNAAGISFLWNGEELPAQGAEAEAKTFVFDAHGMRALASDQAPH